MDGNTRLCTATAAAAMKESFGADGQPGSYTDIEHCDALFLFGHNMAETQTVLWARVLDRTRGEDPPTLVCVDPRRTSIADEAVRSGGVHLAGRVGTNLALMNGLTRELFVNGWVDDAWVAAHTLGMEDLRATVEPYTPEEVARICDVDTDDVRRAARIFGESTNVDGHRPRSAGAPRQRAPGGGHRRRSRHLTAAGMAEHPHEGGRTPGTHRQPSVTGSRRTAGADTSTVRVLSGSGRTRRGGARRGGHPRRCRGRCRT
jgi:anaerobic selenocysteine-containing dehydrogenase